MSVFSVSSAGSLTPVPGSPFGAGVDGPKSVAFSPSGGFVAVGGGYGAGSGQVSVFSVSSGGALTPVPGSPFGSGAVPDRYGEAYATQAQTERRAAAVPAALGCDAVFNLTFNPAFNTGFPSGFNSAFNLAFRQGYKAGFAKGRRHR